MLLTKVHNDWAKKVQMGFILWHYMVMLNLKKKWLVVWEMIWRIWQIFTRALKSLKIGTFIESFYTKWKIYELKTYRGVLFYYNEKWCKIWKGIYLPVQNWHEGFNKFCPEHSKISKVCTLMGRFWPKYIMLELRKYRGVMFDDTQDWCKIWRKTDECFQKRHEEFDECSPEDLKVSKLGPWCHLFI